ncbi:MAG: hypothetical protein DBY41_03480 [Clostridium sp.]|nr:MAG: hypothetical protein DBY41_03480 [Clostridium sp.]
MAKNAYICHINIVNLMEKEIGISEKIKKRILDKGQGKLHCVADFYDLGNDRVVRQALIRLEKRGILERVKRGVYLLPEVDAEIGVLHPSLDDIAKTIAERDNVQILPTGALALNILGLSTQVPMNAVYVTTGASKIVRVGKRKITFRRVTPKYFAFKAKVSPLIVFALQEIKEKNVTEGIIEQLKKVLEKSNELELLQDDLKKYPAWIREIVINILKVIK